MVYEKIIRGCEYVLNNGRYIEAPYLLEVWDDKVSGTFDGIFNAAKPVATLGPGFVVRRGFAAEDLLSVMYKINFWGKYDILASIAVP